MSSKNKKAKFESKIQSQKETEYSIFQKEEFDEKFKIDSSSEHFSFLKKEFEKLIKEINDPYRDNFRWCIIGDSETEENFRISESRGCCGFAYKIVTDKKTNVAYRIGFNYGH